MALYAIGDLHLSFSVNKPMDVFGPQWKNHVSRIRENWLSEISPEDTVVVTGDHSWGRNLEEARADLEFIAALPGRKILLRGNHDMFWDAKKTGKLNQEFQGRLNSFRIIIILTMTMLWWEPRDIVMKAGIPLNSWKSFFPGRRFGLELLLRWRWEMDTGNLSCFFIIRLPASMSRTAVLPGWPRSMGQRRWFIPIVMAGGGMGTASEGTGGEWNIVWFLPIIWSLCRPESGEGNS